MSFATVVAKGEAGVTGTRWCHAMEEGRAHETRIQGDAQVVEGRAFDLSGAFVVQGEFTRFEPWAGWSACTLPTAKAPAIRRKIKAMLPDGLQLFGKIVRL